MDTREKLHKRQLEHLDALLERFRAITQLSDRDDFDRYTSEDKVMSMSRAFVIRAYKTILDIVGPNSPYSLQAKAFYDGMENRYHEPVAAENLSMLVEELRNELELGSLDSIAELLHAEIFDDFISMAQHLNDEKYKDASAVICGGTLESHLRHLCLKHDIVTQLKNGQMKRAQRLNEDLGKSAYSKYDQKMVTAWLDLRNSAAHGNYDDYTSKQVQQFIDWLADFIERNPA